MDGVIDGIIDPKLGFDDDFRKRLAALIVSWAILHMPVFRVRIRSAIEAAVGSMSAAGLHELDIGAVVVTEELVEDLRRLVDGDPFLSHASARCGLLVPDLEWRLKLDVGRMVKTRGDWTEIRHRIQRDVRDRKKVKRVIES